MDLASLRADVRDLIGSGVFDRSFEQGWANEAINISCNQVAARMGLTRVEVALLVAGGKSLLPGDVISVDSVRIGVAPPAISAPPVFVSRGVGPWPVIASLPEIAGAVYSWTITDTSVDQFPTPFSGDGTRSISLDGPPIIGSADPLYEMTFSCTVLVGSVSIVATPAIMEVQY
jgi:hypothetical protein